jgi:hypothetical protein
VTSTSFEERSVVESGGDRQQGESAPAGEPLRVYETNRVCLGRLTLDSDVIEASSRTISRASRRQERLRS